MRDASNPDVYFLLAGATLTEALYMAYERDPTNPRVQATVASGLAGAVIVKSDCPMEVQKYLTQEHNSWGAGS